MANGILIVDKPDGWTSQDVAAKLRGVFHEKRIGHGGTLDPMATGVLPIFIGRATRGVEFFESAEKEYIAGIRLLKAADDAQCGRFAAAGRAEQGHELAALDGQRNAAQHRRSVKFFFQVLQIDQILIQSSSLSPNR